MDTFTLGVIIFALMMAIFAGLIVRTLLGARAQGLSNREILPRLLPLIIAESAFTVFFVIWVISQQS
jgi:hypothetical protein